jgi:hypothetical protein
MQLAASLLLVLASAGACAPAAPSKVSSLIDQAIDLARRETAVTETAGTEQGGSRELVHTAGVTQAVAFVPGARELVLETWTRREGTPEFEHVRSRLLADGAIEAVAARAPWELYVALRADSGEVVLQRWLVRPRKGASDDEPTASAERRDGTQAAGERLEPEEAVTSVRATLLRTRDLGGVRILACDPDGRYLLALDRAGERVLQVPSQRGAAGYAIFEADRLPALRTACGLFFGRHVRQGAVWAFESSGENGLERAVFVDRDEDGTFDEIVDLDTAAWAQSGFQGEVWTEQRFVAAR